MSNINYLLDLVFGRINPPSVEEGEKIPLKCVKLDTLNLMQRLITIEFLSSLHKEIDTDDGNNEVTSPKPFDVFLVEPTFTNKNITIAVCMKQNKSESLLKKEKNLLYWLDENDENWELNELCIIRKVSSLSGTVRVLDNLSIGIHTSKLMQCAMARSDLYDVSLLKIAPDLAFKYRHKLNQSQIRAVAALGSESFKDGFFALLGPPGTGKSTTLAEMILTSTGKCIASAPSNTAVANIALKLFETKRIDLIDVCVYGQNCDESVRFLNPCFRQTKFSEFLEKLHPHKRGSENAKSELRKFCSWLHHDYTEDVEKLANICLKDEANCLLHAKVVSCTLNSSASRYLHMHAGIRESFFLDEAGQCTEADFYLSTAFPFIEKIVVIGDPMQLPPTVIDQDCKKAGLGVSWLKNIHNLYPKKVHLLKTQYRMDPMILKFPNRWFYQNHIKSDESVISRYPTVKRPIGFIDTSNRSMEEKEKYSTKNEGEALLIRALIRQDEDIQCLLRLPETTVAVITPYLAQEKLLNIELKKVKCLRNYTVSTVDSFQGQEADIVIISTVRTLQIGFVDDSQRLNVALTRAKRVVRVVGCKKLFKKLPQGSTLRKLISFLDEKKYTVDINVRNLVFSYPDWRIDMIWKPAFTQKCLYCLKSFDYKEKALLLTTFHSITTPNLMALYQRPSDVYWQISSLRGYRDYSIVWIAKQGNMIEAHFCGNKKKCHDFVQVQSALPEKACKVRKDLSGLKMIPKSKNTTNVITSWNFNNTLQTAIRENTFDVLPHGTFNLDEEQAAVMQSKSPLLLQSRSGTGKTNVLFQRAVMLSRNLSKEKRKMPLIFITVSKLLSTQLEIMFNEVKKVYDTELSSCIFMSLSAFIDGLASRLDLKGHVSNVSSFNEYLRGKKSHKSMIIESTLIENEIGGVIMGSSKSAEICRPLNWDEYKKTKRSNIVGVNDSDFAIRRFIYDEYLLYTKWKCDNGRYDLNDIVLNILKELKYTQNRQMFSGIFLDEVQDFSYSMIYLICSIGGTDTLEWVFAGDTAQMISPGCSFKFAGLKETLLSVKPGIESQLKRVDYLLINYRTTKDILQLANSILEKAKKCFPGAIEFGQKERAAKNFGMKVVLCDWDSALSTKPSFGKDQALIHSFSTELLDESVVSLNSWLDDHPFILSTLDSKGLEFDDIVIAFNLENKSWKIESKDELALKMLRELYVAVTRAKRRVVILVKKNSYHMTNFLNSLDYNLNFYSDYSGLFEEFRTCSSDKDWQKRAEELLKDERYLLSSRCFEKAGLVAMSSMARGKHFASIKDNLQARRNFISASDQFYEQNLYKKILDIAIDFIKVVDWDERPPKFLNSTIFEAARKKEPTYIPNNTSIRIDIFMNLWTRISVSDFKREYFLVNKRRNFKELIQHLQSFTENDLRTVASFIPCIVGDLKIKQGNLIEAVDLYMLGKDKDGIVSSSLSLIHHVKKEKSSKLNLLLELEEVWKRHCVILNQILQFHQNSILRRVSCLFNNPEEAADVYSSKCIDDVGPEAIKFLLRTKKIDRKLLHAFCKDIFHNEVMRHLQVEFKENSKEIVSWFVSNNDKKHAWALVTERISLWSLGELQQFRCDGYLTIALGHEFGKRHQIVDAMEVFLKLCDINGVLGVADLALSSQKGAEKYALKIAKMLKDIKVNNKFPRVELIKQLYNQPQQMVKIDCDKARRNFGPNVIKEFILRKSSYSTHKMKDGKDLSSYKDINDVLKYFGLGMNRRTILDHFGRRNIDCTDFIRHHLNKWTPTELKDITDRYGYYFDELAELYCKKHQYTDAAKLFMRGENYEKAINACESEFKSRKTRNTGTNYEEIRKIWLKRNNEIVHSDLEEKIPKDSDLFQFLHLWQNPIEVSDNLEQRRLCLLTFGSKVIFKAVVRSFLIDYENFGGIDPFDLIQIFGQHDNSLQRITKIDILRQLLQEKRGNDENEIILSYLDMNLNYWMENIDNIRNDDLRLFLRMNFYLQDMDLILIERAMNIETLEFYLETENFTGAVDLSNKMIDNKEGQDYKRMYYLWSKFRASWDQVPQNCHLRLLLLLLNNPVRELSNSKDFGQKCISILGSDLVENAVPHQHKAQILFDLNPKTFAKYKSRKKVKAPFRK